MSADTRPLKPIINKDENNSIEQINFNLNERHIFAIAFLVIALAIGYYFVFYIPQKDGAERASQEKIQSNKDAAQLQLQTLQAEQKSQQAKNLQSCLDSASEQNQADWATACKSFGQNGNTSADCNLPAYNGNLVTQYFKDAKDTCFKRFPQ